MRYFYDTEFLEDGQTIELISIGIVAEDGREYYAVVDTVYGEPLATRIAGHPWLTANVVPHLPPLSDENVLSRETIADEVRGFLTNGGADKNPQLWAWYGAYDHVALCQLWGRMIDLPDGVPMWTNDLKQEVVRRGNPKLPKQAEAQEHDALADARWTRLAYEWVTGR